MKLTQVAAIAALLFASYAQAQTVPAEDFAKRPEAWEVSLSPSGTQVALAVPTPDGKETRLEVVDLDTGKSQVMRFGKQQHVSDIVWTADDQLVVSRAELVPFKARPISQGELYTTDVKAKNQDVLFGFVPDMETKRGKRKDHGISVITKVLNNEPGMALVDFTCWDCGEEPDTVIFKVDTHTGVRKEVERSNSLAGFQFDQTGEARLRTTLDENDEPVLYYRREKGSDWTPLPKSIAGRTINSTRFANDNNTAYALVTDALEPAQAYRIDLKAGTRTKLAGNPDIEVNGFMYAGFGGIPFAVTYDAAKPELQYIDPSSEWAQLHAGLMKSFPGEMLSFNSFSRDGNKVLFSVWSDRDVGSYYVYDRKTKKAQNIITAKPWLKADAMAPTRPIEFTNRDGQKLFGFYTAKGTGPKPMIVMAHGGPYYVHDTWGFDNQVQFLASRGYSVLQVNYRGSDGRGEAFARSGFKGWGTILQNDITDGVRWAIEQKLADPQRICSFGASFGGYTALIQPILNPGMYKCAIGYVGVYDLPLMRKTDKNLGQAKRDTRFFDRTLGTDMDALANISPVERVKDLHVPVMLVHGADDKTADFNQYKAMAASLNASGHPAETYVAAGEGHGFVKPENVTELYKRMEAFLNKYIGPDAK
ncbi:prolyl oligopeptidase family serine peptidase [Thermomonas sp.]|uniref:alpha/beta hydrolase family protein n=1 Tax=Thermomonas sp. TaxID=1971895 RepID=UPI00248A109E|nr:prolyl oligopeptidase family serine peptidase [Thermomonas sp.]MDI1253913.1 prolyl oligopeptidase family serine peptidase [Thermomonas sp.]